VGLSSLVLSQVGRNPRDEHVRVAECASHLLVEGLNVCLEQSGKKVGKKQVPILWFPIENNEWSLNTLPEAISGKKYIDFGDSERQSAWRRDLKEELANAEALRSLEAFLEENKKEYSKGGLPLETLPEGGAAPPASQKGQEGQAASGRGAASMGDVAMVDAPPATASEPPNKRRGRGEGQGAPWWKGDGTGGGDKSERKRRTLVDEDESDEVKKRAKTEPEGVQSAVAVKSGARGGSGERKEPKPALKPESQQPKSKPEQQQSQPQVGLDERVAAHRKELKALQGKGGEDLAVCALRLFRLTVELAAQKATKGEKEQFSKHLDQAKGLLFQTLAGVSFSQLGQARKDVPGSKPDCNQFSPLFKQLRITAKYCQKNSKSTPGENGAQAQLRPLHTSAARRMLEWVQEFLDGKGSKGTTPNRAAVASTGQNPGKAQADPRQTPAKPASEAMTPPPLPHFKPAQVVQPEYPDVTGVLTMSSTRNKILLLVVNALLPYVQGPAEWPKAVSTGAATEAALYKAHVWEKDSVHPLSVPYLESFKELYTELAKSEGGAGEHLCRNLLASGPSACGL